ncbi:MAG: aminotransferase class V-fold PLP-dependent enzyme [Nitrospinae bacterium]|nr:aminotransferase class V-fold PLP-dependent enzyme [Nitrospinota bacterium]
MKSVTYLDNASSSFPKPPGVIRAVTRALAKTGANPNRAGHTLGRAASRIVFETREALAELLRLPNPERIIFTKNATEGINLALKGLLRRGDKVAISGVEHNAVIRPLTGLAKRGVKVEHAPLTAQGLPDPRRIPDVKLLVTVTGSNVSGAMADIPRLAAACRKKGVMLMLDTAQTAGAVPSDFAAADIVAGTGHKALLGPQGTGFVWFRKGIEPEPLIEGGTGSFSESGSMPPFWPDRHEVPRPLHYKAWRDAVLRRASPRSQGPMSGAEGKIIVVFTTTHETMKAEKALKAAGIKFRPTTKPRALGGSCQLALIVAPESVDMVKDETQKSGLAPEGFYTQTGAGEWRRVD